MITIFLNGEMISLAGSMTLQGLIQQRQLVENSFAVAINQQFVPRTQYSITVLKQSDQIEIVMPMQGG